jgi:hypothetical protein
MNKETISSPSPPTGPMGTFMKINKHELIIDEVHQRERSQKRVKEIAENWSWELCGCLTIVRQSNGQFAVDDGGYRALAALKIDDIDDLPCLVFEQLH